jgi:microcystin-dependent protein
MPFYNIEKKLRTAEIGTILPWAGDKTSSLKGYENDTRIGIPDGWIICDGSTQSATSYPLLAEAIGTTYGGSITGTFPDYNQIDQFQIPNIQGRHLADYSRDYLPVDVEVQTAIRPLLGAGRVPASGGTTFQVFDTDESVDVTPSVSANVNFSVASSSTLVGKTTQLTLDDPSYFKLMYTVKRKLGQNHTPSHNHTGEYPTLDVQTGAGVELFQFPVPRYEGNGQKIVGWIGVSGEVSYPDWADPVIVIGNSSASEYAAHQGSSNLWSGMTLLTSGSKKYGIQYWKASAPNNGEAFHTVYSSDKQTHVITSVPQNFNNSSAGGQPLETGYFPPKSSQYPYLRSGTGSGRNWSNLNQGGIDVTYATTINHNYDQWSTKYPLGHEHGAIEFTMNKGNLKPPVTVYHNDVQTHNLTPQNIPNALVMNVTAETPSMNILYIIRAY